MFQSYHSDPYVLSSSCPYSRSLINFASRIGGVLDPDFLMQCQVADKKLQKMIDGLKQIPLKYEPLSSNSNYGNEIFLDIDAPNKQQFFDLHQFQHYNRWLFNQNHLNLMDYFNDDLII